MSTVALIAIGAVVFIVLIWRLLAPSVERIVDQAIAEKNITPVVEAVTKHKPSAQPTLFNHAIRRMWDRYERELATELVRTLVERHQESQIAQYWLKQVATAEPKLATTILTKSFFDDHYLPEVAAQCGQVG